MENSFGSIINSAKSILILLPSKPYFDQVAAGLGLYLGLRDKAETNIVCPSQMIVEFNRLVGIDRIKTEFGNKNLVIKFTDYKASDIEKVSYDVENGEFRLTVVPKPEFAAPKKEQVGLSYSGVSADTVILVGGATESHFPSLASEELSGTKIIHIGIRAVSLGQKTVISFARPASSVSELIADLLKELNVALDADMATNLLMGIEEGSKNFKGQDVNAETFQTVADLIRAGGKRIPGERIEKSSFPPGAIPGEVVSEPEKKEEPPKDWLEPKIYKGTTVS
jgi:hypothetical protein